MFWSKNKKNSYTPANLLFYIKVVYMSWICFPDLSFYAQLGLNEIYPAHNIEMSIQVIIPPRQNEVLRGVYCFHIVRPSVRASVRPSVHP